MPLRFEVPASGAVEQSILISHASHSGRLSASRGDAVRILVTPKTEREPEFEAPATGRGADETSATTLGRDCRATTAWGARRSNAADGAAGMLWMAFGLERVCLRAHRPLSASRDSYPGLVNTDFNFMRSARAEVRKWPLRAGPCCDIQAEPSTDEVVAGGLVDGGGQFTPHRPAMSLSPAMSLRDI
jgi:hypothetical protein